MRNERLIGVLLLAASLMISDNLCTGYQQRDFDMRDDFHVNTLRKRLSFGI